MKKRLRCGTLVSKSVEAWPRDEWWPVAPLRAYRFTTAGGRASIVEAGRPMSAILKINYDGKNVYSNKIVAIDEGHHVMKIL